MKIFSLLFTLLAFIACSDKSSDTSGLIGSDTSLQEGDANISSTLVITSFIEPVAATYGEGSNLLFQVNFDGVVNITGTPRIGLNIGGTTVYANYSSGSGTSGVEFTYTVEATHNDSDGITVTSALINLNGGTVKDSDGNNVSLNFSSYLDSMASVLIDTSSGITAPNQVLSVVTAPTTSNTSLSIAWSAPNNNGTAIIDYSVQYREQGQSTWNTVNPKPSINQAIVSGLVSGTIYEFRVAANNGLLGEYSSITTASIFDVSALNPIAWLSATNVTNGGTEPSHGDKIATWTDLTGIAGDAVEPLTTKQPTYETNVFNGLPAIRFNGEAQGLQGSFTRVNNGGLTVFLVGKMDTNTSREAFFEFYKTGGGGRGFFFNYGFNVATTNHHLDDTNLNLWSAYDTGTHTDFWENGQVIYTNFPNWENGTSTAFTGAGSYVLGDDQTGADELHGYICEFLIFDKELTATEKLQIETYLKNKWGTP